MISRTDDYRQMNIFPDKSDILNDHSPFIRKNIVEGKYVGGVDHYLDVQFRLLREDFIRPLRNSIRHYRAIKLKADEMGRYKMMKKKFKKLPPISTKKLISHIQN